MLRVDFGGTGRGGQWLTVNVDGHGIAHPAPDVVADITAQADQLRHHFAPASIDEAQCIATFEHLPPHDHVATLKMWRGLLKPGSRLTIMVPDVAQIAADWLDNQLPTRVAMGMIFCPPEWQRMLPGEQHRWGFNRESLITLLVEAGYVMAQWDANYPQRTFFVEGYPVPNLAVEAYA